MDKKEDFIYPKEVYIDKIEKKLKISFSTEQMVKTKMMIIEAYHRGIIPDDEYKKIKIKCDDFYKREGTVGFGSINLLSWTESRETSPQEFMHKLIGHLQPQEREEDIKQEDKIGSIATPTYGSYNHSSVVEYREFRDKVLYSNYLEKLFVKLYYKISPSIVDFIKSINKLRDFLTNFLNIYCKK
ncbi:MAG: CFI-box-CTERM domain-containing protein [Candidatus Stygibacter australis]|nr:CFI-box-CTERM domain-containing protein [Candidatus Stygibacter australis]MDP8322008.1 CFI-box-CTERM domain-containing protein [Candidatus Stygibacter australis]